MLTPAANGHALQGRKLFAEGHGEIAGTTYALGESPSVSVGLQQGPCI